MKILKFLLITLVLGPIQLIASDNHDVNPAFRAFLEEHARHEAQVEENHRKAFDLPIFKLLNEQKFDEAQKLIESNPGVLSQINSLNNTPLNFLVKESISGTDLEVTKKYQHFLIQLLGNQNIRISNVINIQADRSLSLTLLCFAAYLGNTLRPLIGMSPTIQPNVEFIEKQLIPKLLEAGADPSLCSVEQQKAIAPMLKELQKKQQEEGRQGRMALNRVMQTKQGAILPEDMNRKIINFLLPQEPAKPATQSTSASAAGSLSITPSTGTASTSSTSSTSGGLEDVD